MEHHCDKLEHCRVVPLKSTETRAKITEVRSFTSTLDITEISIEMDGHLVESMCGKTLVRISICPHLSGIISILTRTLLIWSNLTALM